MPIAKPTMPCSHSGVLNTRSFLNSSSRLTVQRKTPPKPTSSPNTTAFSSSVIAARIAALIALHMFVSSVGPSSPSASARSRSGKWCGHSCRCCPGASAIAAAAAVARPRRWPGRPLRRRRPAPAQRPEGRRLAKRAEPARGGGRARQAPALGGAGSARASSSAARRASADMVWSLRSV